LDSSSRWAAADTEAYRVSTRTKGTTTMVLASSVGGGAAIGLILLVGLYFVPTIVAYKRQVTDKGSVVVINLFLGWTLIGWVGALALACRTSTRGY